MVSIGGAFHLFFLIVVLAVVGSVVVSVVNRIRKPADPIQQEAQAQSILFEGRVWVRSPPSLRMGLLGGPISRWTLVVRSGSIELTGQLWGSAGPQYRHHLFLRSAGSSMWTTRIGQRDCIVLSGVAHGQPVEVCVSAGGQNQVVWSALSEAGVRSAAT